MKIRDDIRYIGVNDHEVDLFEGQYVVPRGMAYNSYLIDDEKKAVLDTVDANFGDEWLKNIEDAAKGAKIDYLVVHHMEPDHSANIAKFAAHYPEALIVSSAQAFTMMKNFFGDDFASRRIVVKEGDTLSTGRHNLAFVAAPMVHWPEVIVTYDVHDKVLFSADGFGKFGALDVQEPWEDEARRYFIGIVGKYGPQVQAVLKKLAPLPIKMIAPLHGFVFREAKTISEFVGKYDAWSTYTPERTEVMIAYASIYGNVGYMALPLAQAVLGDEGVFYCATGVVVFNIFCFHGQSGSIGMSAKVFQQIATRVYGFV